MMAASMRSALKPFAPIFQDRLAIVGLAVLSCIVALALFAPLLATHDPDLVNEIEEGSVLSRDPSGSSTVWRVVESLGPLAIQASDAYGNQGLAVGRGGVAYLYDEGGWRTLNTGTPHDLNGVAFSADGKRALAVGANATVLLWDGEWKPVLADPPSGAELRDVAWVSDTQALAVGGAEEIWLLDLASNAFTPIKSPVGRGFALNAVERDSDGALLMVGDRGLAIRYAPDTQSVKVERLGTSRMLNSLTIAPGGVALAVGERGTLMRRDGPQARWRQDESPEIRALRAGWINDEGHAYAVGRSGIILERLGGEWQRIEAESERHLRSVLVVADTAFALGSDRFVNRLAPPSSQHWFGTDHLGRDLFSQNVYGARIALLVGFLGASLVVLIGANVGLIAGYYRGRVDTLLMRTVDVIYGIPFEPFALILVLLFEPSLLIVILAISLLTWRTTARLIRSQVLSLRERPFVKAARVAGASDLRIMYLHIFPNVMPLVFLELAIIVGVSIIAEATLSFLGLGPPQSISWGGILHNARLSGAWRTAWWWNLPPGMLIMITVLSVFFISRSLELIANPRLRVRQ